MQKSLQDIKLLALLLLMAVFLNTACKKPRTFPDEPQITYDSYSRLPGISGKDSLLLVKFAFTDGDGDIGLGQEDTLAPFNSSSRYYYNIMIEYYEKVPGGDFHKIPIPNSNDTINFNQRLPVITPEGKNKAIKGTIEVKISTSVYQQVPERIKFKIKLLDRKLNESNEIETEEISVNL
jgi:hypothetical protein